MDESRFELFVGLMNRSIKAIQRIKSAKMKKYRLSAAHTTCLCKLSEAGPDGLTQGQLIALEGMDRAHISRVVRELAHRGYVVPLDQGGRYNRRYALTAAGEEITQEIQAIILDVNRFVSDQIPAEDILVFYRTLHTIARNLDRAVDTYCPVETTVGGT